MAAVLATMVAAPLLAGGVHRPVVIGLLSVAAVGVTAVCVALRLEGRSFRTDATIALPFILMVVPLLQSIPLPYGLRALLDRSGTDLLLANQPIPTSAWPLSLDPPRTRVSAGVAAAGLAAFLLAYHLASGKSRRHLVLRVVGLTGIAAVVVGLGHRIVGSDKLYGLFNVPVRSLLVGPFVNSNHTSEFLELTAFVCLACAILKPTLLNRTGWLVGTVLCAGGAAATLSRGAVLALTAGLACFAGLQYAGARASGPGLGRAKLRVAMLWGAVVLGLIVIGILSLGADQLVGRFKADAVGTDVRFRLWQDGVHLFRVHPAGIGRGAFDRIFPIYRSLKTPFPLRFSFLENEPLQLLVDCGWVFALLILGAFVYLIARLVSSGRRDPIEAALCAGLVAVLAHGLVDFGLETLGVLMPFCAVLGTLFGRLSADDQPVVRLLGPRASWAVAGAVVFGLAFGAAATAHPSNQDFDARLKGSHTREEQLAILDRAERAHPLDYLYPLELARLEPLAGAPSPRLHALNRAMRLCPSCESVHTEVARNLWRLGLRRQALLEWRTAVNLQPRLLATLLGELFSVGARPEEMASVAAGEPERMLKVVDFLRDRGRLVDATKVLDQADVLGAPRAETLLERGWLQFEAGDFTAAGQAASAAAAARITDPRLAILQAKILVKRKGDEGVDEALAILDAAAARAPADLALQRERLTLVTHNKRWKAAGRALEGLKYASYRASGTAAEAHVAAAEIAAALGRRSEAVEEYRMALIDRPTDVRLWMDYGRAAEAAGRDAAAHDAYAQAGRLSPGSADIKQAQQALEDRQARLRARLEETTGAAPLP